MGSSLIHVLSIFAIAEDKEQVFLKIKAFLRYRKYLVPTNNGIYELKRWKDVRRCKTKFVQ